MTTTTPTFDRTQIGRLKAHANNNIAMLLDKLGIQYSVRGPLYQACCPCPQHAGNGDNATAFSWKEGIDHWVCWTHSCEEAYGNDIFGLVRSILEIPFKEAVTWVYDALTSRDIDVREEVVRETDTSPSCQTTLKFHAPLDEMRIRFLKPEKPHPFLLNRGYEEDILTRYEIGYWHRLGTYMHDRIVFPIRDASGFLVGFSGRTIHPESEWAKRMIKTKWIHGRYFDQFPQPGEFNITSLLYNLCNAKHILEEYKHTLILVEGPPDGLRFEQAGIQCWSATFGTKAFGQAQRSLLINHGVNRVLLAYDNDKAGQKGVQRVREQIGNLIHVDLFPLPESKDPGECTTEELKDRYLNVIS